MLQWLWRTLKSYDPDFKQPRSQVGVQVPLCPPAGLVPVPGSTHRLPLYTVNWSASCQFRILNVFRQEPMMYGGPQLSHQNQMLTAN